MAWLTSAAATPFSIVLAGILAAGFSAWMALHGLGLTTDTDQMFSRDLPWRQRAIRLDEQFPQFNDLLVAVIDARIPEEADATAARLAAKLAADHAHFLTVRRPDRSAFLQKEGLLFLSTKQLSDLMNRTIDAQPFLGQLVADPTARGLFSALSCSAWASRGAKRTSRPTSTSIRDFHQSLAGALAGHPQPLSWQSLLGGSLSDLAGKYRFVLVQPKQDYGALEPGGEATRAMRRRHRSTALRQGRHRTGAHHRAGRAGRRGVRLGRPGRRRRADRQRGC